MEESNCKDLEVKTSGALIVLTQFDNLVIAVSDSSTLIDDRPSGLANEVTSFQQLGTVKLDADKTVEMTDTNEHIEEMPKLVETLEPERSKKNGKFNLRKSLAWDSAFFTSDGVLDAEELSTMIDGGGKVVKHQLPGIEEEVYRSMDSISTLESDNLTLECLEAELFEDIRASIQKSSRPSNLNCSSMKASSGKKDTQAKVDTPSKKADLDSGKRPAARIKDQTSIPQPKIISKLISTSTLASKRASLSTNHAKKDNDIPKQTHVTQKANQATKTNTTQGSKITGVINPRWGVPKPSLNSKSSSLSSSTGNKTDPTRPSSSCGSSSSSSGNDTTFSRKKVDSKTGKLKPGSIPKTPSRISIKNKAPPGSSRISSSEWSSESSSTSTVNRRSVSRGSMDSSVSVESGLTIRPAGQNASQNGNGPVVVAQSKTGSVSRPPMVQPTGLRMPSPKIGFFDGGKSGVRTPNGSTRPQSRVLTGLPKTHHSPTGPKSGKLPPPKTILKPNSQKIASKGIKSNLPTSNINEESHLGNELWSKTETHENKLDWSRTPFAVKNTGVEEVSGNFSFLESGLKENSEVVEEY